MVEESCSYLGGGENRYVYEWLMKINFYMVSGKIVSNTSQENMEEITQKRAIEF